MVWRSSSALPSFSKDTSSNFSTANFDARIDIGVAKSLDQREAGLVQIAGGGLRRAMDRLCLRHGPPRVRIEDFFLVDVLLIGFFFIFERTCDT